MCSSDLNISSLFPKLDSRYAGAVISYHEFDCLIVDEAHHLAWSENAPSTAYLLVEQLAKGIPSVLLLTATPEQLGLESHFARLRLLDPERFYDYQAFLKEQENYQPVADAVQSLLSEKPLSADEKNHISDLLNERDVEPLFKALGQLATSLLKLPGK